METTIFFILPPLIGIRYSMQDSEKIYTNSAEKTTEEFINCNIHDRKIDQEIPAGPFQDPELAENNRLLQIKIFFFKIVPWSKMNFTCECVHGS
jgi:hypothetical protein